MSDSKQLQPNCKWVKPGWALQPTDFRMSATGARITADVLSVSWSICSHDDEHVWQRPPLLDIDLFHTMKEIKTASYKLPESERQKFIWEMLQVQSQAGDALKEIRERAKAAAKALAESTEPQQ